MTHHNDRPDGSPITIHDVMFLPTLRSQASDEQRKKWLPAAESCAIIGCYAQTEMGHGSDVAGLEVRVHVHSYAMYVSLSFYV